ncbi:hypothetical protein P7C70_g5153, partial [Phenoliferia sp. Uapishka_3]
MLQPSPTATVEIFADWMAFLLKFPNLRTLKIRLAEVERLESDTDNSLDNLSSHYAPSITNQKQFGAYLLKSSLQYLSIEWWPTRTLLSLLPSSLITLALGSNLPYTDGPPPVVDLDGLKRSNLAGVLRHLPNLRVVALPFGNLEVERSSGIRDRSYEELVEFEERRLELEAAGFIVREANSA